MPKVAGTADNEGENFRQLFRHTPEIVCILRGPEHVFEFVNDAHIKVLGFDVTGKRAREAQPDAERLLGILDEVYRTGKTVELREAEVRQAGRLRYFNLTYSATRDACGAVNGIMALGVEVTEQVTARESLREIRERLEQAVHQRTRQLDDSRAFLDSVIENIPNMVFVKDAADLRFVRFNKAGEELLGLSRQQLIGKNDYDFFPNEEADHFVANDREVLAKGAVLDIPEETIQTAGKGKRILHTRKIPILGSHGKPEYLLGISEDITEWKRTEEARLKVIREQAAVEERRRENTRATFLAEASTILASSLDYHETLRDLANLAVPSVADFCLVAIVREDKTLERVAFAHRDPAQAEKLRGECGAPLDEVISEVTSSLRPHFCADTRESPALAGLGAGSCIVAPILVRAEALGAIALFAADGGPAYHESDLAVAADLGRRAGIAIENASLYEAARRAVESRDEFMSIASHELKTPLTSLRLQADLRRLAVERGDYRRFSPENLPRLIEDDCRQVDRLVRLVDDMLDISRIQRGKMQLNPAEFDLSELIADLVARYVGQAGRSGGDLRFREPSPLPVTWDRFRIEQVLTNLITNAIKYGADSLIEVGAARRGGNVRFWVEDHGMGIAVSDQERIFGQFERAVSHRSISGLGLGLFISRRIVEAHGGSIRVKSAPGQGARFEVEIPAVASPHLQDLEFGKGAPTEKRREN